MTPASYALRDDARRFESWESDHAARLGLGAAVDYALALGLEAIEARCRDLADSLRRGLRTIPGVTLHDLGPDPAAIVSFSMAGIDAERVKQGCAAAGLNLSVSTPSSTLLDATARGLPDVVRASPHYFNSEDEIARAIAVISAQAQAQA